MHYPKLAVFFSTIFSFLLVFSSCNNKNPVVNDPEIVRVEGKLVDVVGNPMPDKEVKIRDSVVLTDGNGGFVFDNIEAPYDISVVDNVLNKRYLFKNISITTPVLLLANSSTVQRSALISVTFPNDNALQGKVIFTNHHDINSYADVNSDYSHLAVRTHYHNSITGTLIVLRYSMWSGKISDFKQFGFKENVTIEPNNNYNINFTQDDLSFNPDEETITGSINSTQPPEYTNTFNYISFSDYQYPEYISFFKLETHMGNVNNFSYKFPTNLPIPNKKIIGSISNLIPNKWFFTNVSGLSGNISINSPQTSSLVSPENNAVGINPNTFFKFSSAGENCIYEINFGGYLIYTDKLEFAFGEMEMLGFNFNKSESLTWSVNSLGSYSSMNDFVNHPLLERSSVPSESRAFTTIGN